MCLFKKKIILFNGLGLKGGAVHIAMTDFPKVLAWDCWAMSETVASLKNMGISEF